MDYQSQDFLYNLLPAVYRIRDAEQGYPLKAFLRLIEGQIKIVKEDIDRLWDNFFIETCGDWIIPYIGDLVANNPLYDVVKNNRADVAKTIYYRRRKGTLPMLEELARDITGWACHAVEFFELLNWNQNMNHVRFFSKDCPDLRDLNSMDLINTAFDTAAHTADVRAVNQIKGWYNIKNIGFFLWRLGSYPIENGRANPVSGPGDNRYCFCSLGNPVPLFNHPLREGDEAGLTQEIHVPAAIRPAAFYYDLDSVSAGSSSESVYYGLGKSLLIIKDDAVIPTSDIMCKNLKNWDPVPAGKVGVDVKLGRLIFAAGEEPEKEVAVTYYYGFSADMGGGQYERRKTLIDPSLAEWEITVRHDAAAGPDVVPTLAEALTRWETNKKNGIIHIADNWTYEGGIEIEPGDNIWLAIEAVNNMRPTLRIKGTGNIEIKGDHPNSEIILNGLLIEGGINIQESLGGLSIKHCTMVPGLVLDTEGNPSNSGSPSMQAAAANTSLEVEIDSSITGFLRLPRDMVRLTLRDCVLDGLNSAAIARISTDDKTGPPAVLERTTVFGDVLVKELILANEVIFNGEVLSEKTQSGCIRFSFVSLTSKTPRRFRCQPDLALHNYAKEHEKTVADLTADERSLVISRVVPGYTSVNYGHPAYCQLSYSCCNEIKTGSEVGSEMGVFRSLRQPQRASNLRIRLEEYLPFGLKPGLIYVT